MRDSVPWKQFGPSLVLLFALAASHYISAPAHCTCVRNDAKVFFLILYAHTHGVSTIYYIHMYTHACMNGWMDGGMEGRADGRTDGRTDGDV